MKTVQLATGADELYEQWLVVGLFARLSSDFLCGLLTTICDPQAVWSDSSKISPEKTNNFKLIWEQRPYRALIKRLLRWLFIDSLTSEEWTLYVSLCKGILATFEYSTPHMQSK